MSLSPAQLLRSRLVPPISAITAYDYPTARLSDEAGIQLILVGDSLGMVVAGNPDTTTVTLDHMVYHTEMVRRGVTNAVVVSDLPIHTYDDPDAALISASRLMAAGADAVKLEGGLGQIGKVKRLTLSGVPVCAHIGMLPQRVIEEGGYRKKGKLKEEADRLLEAACALEDAGAFAIVLESMVAEVAARITEAIEIPTIGIGAGTECDGQIRVLHDVIGGYPWFVPPFATVYGNVAEVTREAVASYVKDVGPQEVI
ncbi:MAG: 3-methyl-2-oxobutanoate hydroxymethyltransferase [Verrucomicrobiales bacterium]|nr:3-methyl-2-oxobutanoate hydroxymethyltransferase [Verrucomicrobiales bacterium]